MASSNLAGSSVGLCKPQVRLRLPKQQQQKNERLKRLLKNKIGNGVSKNFASPEMKRKSVKLVHRNSRAKRRLDFDPLRASQDTLPPNGEALPDLKSVLTRLLADRRLIMEEKKNVNSSNRAKLRLKLPTGMNSSRRAKNSATDHVTNVIDLVSHESSPENKSALAMSERFGERSEVSNECFQEKDMDSRDVGIRGFGGPYPNFRRPSSSECRDVRDRLLEFHGFPKEFAKVRQKYLARKVCSNNSYERNESAADLSCERRLSDSESVSYEVHDSVLDSLICTLLSQNTTEENSKRAFASLKARFKTWEEVNSANPTDVEDAIRCGGLAAIKGSRIRKILQTLLEEHGKISLEHLWDLPDDKIKAELGRFEGVGSKTVACLLMFHLNRDDFPVDTHVLRIAKSLGWVPAEASREKAYLHLNCRIPNCLKFDLNCLLVTHGKQCQSCSKKGGTKQKSKVLCPLLTLL